MVGSTQKRLIVWVIGLAMWLAGWTGQTALAQSHGLHEMSLARWAKLREVERHQMQIAEKYYRD